MSLSDKYLLLLLSHMDVNKYGEFISVIKDSTLVNNFGKNLIFQELNSYNTKEEQLWEVQEEVLIA